MFNEDEILSDEELLKITGGDTFATNISVITKPIIIKPLYGIKPQPLYGIIPVDTI